VTDDAVTADGSVGAPEATPAAQGGWFRPAAWLVAIAAGGLLFGIQLRVGSVLCPNDASRWDTIWSLVEKGTYVIDGCPWDTIDKVHREGHDYSSKPPLFPTLCAGEYWLIRKLTKWSIKDRTDLVCRTILFTWNIVPLVVLVGLTGQLIGRHVASPWWRVYWLLAAAFGTYVTGYSVTLNDHSVGAWSAGFALYGAVRILYDDDRRWWVYALVGACAAFTVANQLPAAFFVVVLFIWLLARRPVPTLLFGLPGALIVIAAFLVTLKVSTGGFVPYYLFKKTDLYLYEGSYWRNPVGIDALHEPKPIYLLNLLVGHHGFFSLSPIFLLMVVSLIFALRDARAEVRHLSWFAAGVFLFTVALNTLTTNNYGGVCQGFRYLIWPVPVFIVAAALTADAYGRPKWVRVLAVACLFASLVSAGACTDNPWSESWLEQLCKQHDWLWATY
jgi:hypothetical protein